MKLGSNLGLDLGGLDLFPFVWSDDIRKNDRVEVVGAEDQIYIFKLVEAQGV
jgi:hypothetical protein